MGFYDNNVFGMAVTALPSMIAFVLCIGALIGRITQ